MNSKFVSSISAGYTSFNRQSLSGEQLKTQLTIELDLETRVLAAGNQVLTNLRRTAGFGERGRAMDLTHDNLSVTFWGEPNFSRQIWSKAMVGGPTSVQVGQCRVYCQPTGVYSHRIFGAGSDLVKAAAIWADVSPDDRLAVVLTAVLRYTYQESGGGCNAGQQATMRALYPKLAAGQFKVSIGDSGLLLLS